MNVHYEPKISVIGWWRYKLKYLFLLCLILPQASFAGQDRSLDLPKIGKRLYIVEGAKTGEILPLKRESTVESFFMRDPILVQEDSKDLVMQPILKPRKAVRKSIAAKLTFKNKSILGRYSNPRLRLDLPPLPLSRADEIRRIDPIGNIFRSNVLVEGE